MLERLTHNFRLLLSAFDGGVCPLCAVRTSLEALKVERLSAKGEPGAALCGRHLGTYFESTDNRTTRARLTRETIEVIISGRSGCQVCEYLSRLEARLAQAIRRLDNRMRFRKALEMAPLFCQRHANLIASDQLAVNFAQVQRAKLQHLRDDLAQAEILNRDSLEPLTLSALAYLGRPALEQPLLRLQDSVDESVAAAAEFEKWDDELQLERLGNLESEAASLRYRNAMLSEENCRLKIARVAAEAIRQDLERDRAELMAAAKKHGSSLLKFPNRH